MKKLLIIDDHRMFADGIKFLIECSLNYQVIGILNCGENVCSFLSKNPVDIILLDIELPDISGFELAKNIKKQFPDCQILALSMLSDMGSIQKMMASGASGYCVKSAGRDELFAAIQKTSNELCYLPAFYFPDLKHQKNNFGNMAISSRESEVIQLIVKGSTTNEIATQLFLSPRTVETHRKNIYRKLEVHSNIELTKKAQRLRLI